jgi:hypothetical protein
VLQRDARGVNVNIPPSSGAAPPLARSFLAAASSKVVDVQYLDDFGLFSAWSRNNSCDE